MTVPARPIAGATIGTDWGQTVHDTIVAVDLQSGLVNVTLSNAANASVPVAFPHAFAGAPIVVCSLGSAPGGSNKLIPRSTSQGPSGCTIFVYTGDGTPATATVAVHWVAVGARQ
jgi:hypothetical protein